MFHRTTAIRILVVAFIGIPANTLLAQQKEAFDTSYISADSFFTIVVRPTRLLKYLDKAKAARIASLFAEENGIDLRVMDEAIIDFGGGAKDALVYGAENITILGRFHGGFNRKALLSQLDLGDSAKHDGMTYYPVLDQSRPAAYFPGRNSFVLAENNRLKKLMSQRHSMNTIVRRLREAGRDYDLLLVAEVDSGRAAINEFLRNGNVSAIGEFKPQNLVDGIHTATLRAKLSDDVPLMVSIAAKDERAAQEIQSMAKGLLLMVKVMWAASREGLLDADPNEEMAKMTVGVVDQLLAGAKIETKARKVTIRVEKKGGLTELADVAAFGMFGRQLQIEDVDAIDKPDRVPDPRVPDRPKR